MQVFKDILPTLHHVDLIQPVVHSPLVLSDNHIFQSSTAKKKVDPPKKEDPPAKEDPPSDFPADATDAEKKKEEEEEESQYLLLKDEWMTAHDLTEA